MCEGAGDGGPAPPPADQAPCSALLASITHFLFIYLSTYLFTFIFNLFIYSKSHTSKFSVQLSSPHQLSSCISRQMSSSCY